MVNIQANKWNQGIEGSFTVNLGVYFPEVARLTDAPGFKGYPKEYDCIVQQRLGPLMHGGRDIWWSIESDTKLSDLATKVGTAWAVFGKPWLDRTSTLPGAHAELVGQKMFFIAAAISLLLGHRVEAAQLIEQAMQRQPRAADRIAKWGHQHGLLMKDEV